MASLSPGDVLRVWEAAAFQTPVERALTVLAAAHPEIPSDVLAGLSIGERDARLLDVRQATFGREATAVDTCGRCGERVELAVDLRALQLPAAPPGDGEIDADGFEVRFRVPRSDDLAAAVGSRDPRRTLALRCVLEVRRGGAAVPAQDLPAEAIAALAAAMARRDPQAEILLDYACPACDQAGQAVFDIAAFLWEEIRARAQRLLLEVATLARAFGWREADILAMGATRRRAYLELVS